MSNRTRRLSIGVTNDLVRHVYEHKHRLVQSFTSKYFLDRLVYCEKINGRCRSHRPQRTQKLAPLEENSLTEKVSPNGQTSAGTIKGAVSTGKSLRDDPSPSPLHTAQLRSG
jgi:putative endonuclease